MSTYSNRLQPALQNYNALFRSSTRDRHAWRIISADVQRTTLNASCMSMSGGRTEQLDCRFSAASLALRVIFSVS